MPPAATVDGGPVEWPAIVVHGGAGGYERVHRDPSLVAGLAAAVDAALDAGWAVLTAGGPPLDAVVAAVRSMEDSGRFNAGRGSVPTSSGSVEMDASVMDDTGRAGAVACLTGRSAVAAAHAVWADYDRSGVLLLAGPGADAFALARALPAIDPVARDGGADPPVLPPLSSHGTVGAVAVSASGRMAAASSTGGRAGQPPGRVGDTPIPGAAVWAEPGCAVSATGAGEAFVLAGFARYVAARRSANGGLDAAMQDGLGEVARFGGEGGAIALGADRSWVAAFDTAAMARGLRHPGGRHGVISG